MAGTSSKGSGLVGADARGFVEQEETSRLDIARNKLMSTEWTDEKHNLYLKSMEASFVNQLYNSMNALSSHPCKDFGSYGRSPICAKPHTSSQFKVHQNGCWQRTNFERAGTQPEQVHEHHIQKIQWVQDPRARSRRDTIFGIRTKNVSEKCKSVNYGGKKSLTSGLADFSKQPTASCAQTGASNISEEYSDQNFVDEDKANGVLANPRVAKKLKSVAAATPNNDQVVPSGTSLGADISDGPFACPRRASGKKSSEFRLMM